MVVQFDQARIDRIARANRSGVLEPGRRRCVGGQHGLDDSGVDVHGTPIEHVERVVHRDDSALEGVAGTGQRIDGRLGHG